MSQWVCVEFTRDSSDGNKLGSVTVGPAKAGPLFAGIEPNMQSVMLYVERLPDDDNAAVVIKAWQRIREEAPQYHR